MRVDAGRLGVILCGILLVRGIHLRGEESAALLDAVQARQVLESAPQRPRQVTKAWSPELSRNYGIAGGTKGILVVRRRDGSEEHYPYVELPILFVLNGVEYYDGASRSNVEELASILRELCQDQPEASFRVEGHSSAEGPAGLNRALSERRATKIRDVLKRDHGVRGDALCAVGYGEEFARYADMAPERDLQQDRRVIVVRVR